MQALKQIKRSSSSFIKIVEVGPRDGLQNEKMLIPLDTKLKFIHKLKETGLDTIEAGSFVSSKRVPQMKDTSEIMKQLPTMGNYPCLVPNLKGLDSAIKAGCTEIAVFAAASESFSSRNINSSIDASLTNFEKVISLACSQNIKVRGYVSTVISCPYEGPISPLKVEYVSKRLYEMGCYEISLGDTIGTGTPLKFRTLIDQVSKSVPVDKLAVHCHDTYGQALANILVSVERGVRVVDSSTSGLGGCPFALGASGNVATEDVVYMLHGMGYDTGIDLDKLVDVGEWISGCLERTNMSKAGVAILNKRRRAKL